MVRQFDLAGRLTAQIDGLDRLTWNRIEAAGTCGWSAAIRPTPGR